MANLKEIRSRISSVGSTMQITNAMKMVSAAKLKRAQDSIVQLRPYADKLRDILQNISSTLDSNVGGELTVHLRSEEHTSELQSRGHLVCRLLLEKKT